MHVQSKTERNLTDAMLSDGAGCSDNVVSEALHPGGENRNEIVQDDPLASAKMSFAGNKRFKESTFQGVVVTVSSALSCNNHNILLMIKQDIGNSSRRLENLSLSILNMLQCAKTYSTIS